MAEFFGEQPVIRITTLSTPNLLARRLRDVFGDDPQFNEDMGKKMKH